MNMCKSFFLHIWRYCEAPLPLSVYNVQSSLPFFFLFFTIEKFGRKEKGEGRKNIPRWSKRYTKKDWRCISKLECYLAWVKLWVWFTAPPKQESQSIGMKNKCLIIVMLFWNHRCFGWRKVIWKDHCNMGEVLFLLKFYFICMVFFFTPMFVYHSHDIPMVARRGH